MFNNEGSKYLSKTERKRFDAMVRFNSIKDAAAFLRLDPSTLYNWRSQLNKRYKFRRGWINAIEAQRKRAKNIQRIFISKKPIEPFEEDIDREEEE